jgi:hypothetical protein
MATRRFRWRASTVATITAVAAILLGIWDSTQTRRHNRLSVAPYLVVDYTVEASEEQSRYTVSLTNEGVGPAIVSSVRISLPASLGGGTYDDWGQVASLLRTRGFTVPTYWNFEGGEALGVQKNRQLVAAFIPRSASTAAMQERIAGIQIVVKYASVYGDEYEARLQNELPASN